MNQFFFSSQDVAGLIFMCGVYTNNIESGALSKKT